MEPHAGLSATRNGYVSPSGEEPLILCNGVDSMMKKILFTPLNESLQPVFNFDLEKIQESIESGVISFPRGLTGEERREWIRNRLEAEAPST